MHIARRFVPRSPTVRRLVYLKCFNGRPSNESRAVSTRASLLLDFDHLLENRTDFENNISQRKSSANIDTILTLHQASKSIQTKIRDVQEQRNLIANSIKKNPGDISETNIQQGKSLKVLSQELANELDEIERDLIIEVSQVPNTSSLQSPDAGMPPSVINSFGPSKKKITVQSSSNIIDDISQKSDCISFRDHVQIAKDADLIDFESGAKTSGSKFYFLKNEAALLESALTQWTLMRLRKKGFTPMTCPDIVHNHIITGCGFSPRGESSQIYSISGSDLSLAATAEIPLAGMCSNVIFEDDKLGDATGQIRSTQKHSRTPKLPLLSAGVGHCFRTEAGALGRDTAGIYRVHQFTKVEMFVVCTPQDAEKQFQMLVDTQRELHEELGLHGVQLEMPVDELG